jgi:hypothetical protein
MGQSVDPAPGWRYWPRHQRPSAVLWLYHTWPPRSYRFSTALCAWQYGVSSLSGCVVRWAGGCGGAWTLSHCEACSTCALTLAKSTPRKVTMTSWPCRVAFSVMLTGASGSGTVGAGDCASGSAGAGAGAGAAAAWPLLAACRLALTSSWARRASPKAKVGRDKAQCQSLFPHRRVAGRDCSRQAP